ncbi:MAG: D-aminoacyl-tRNA deacylase [Clostridiales bacterium]|nr:D-aminoacyl-tRNA deacylase [Clostridiales bacterium]
MRAVVQRVSEAKVSIDGKVFSEIKKGLLLLIAVSTEDQEDDVKYLAEKCVGLRVFEDDNGKMNLSAKDIDGEFLIIPNFTLYGDCSHGKRPNFMSAERPERAVRLFELFLSHCKTIGASVCSGRFGADMKVSLINDGPITIFMDTVQMKIK